MSHSVLISAPFGYSIKNLLYSSFWESETVKNASIVTVLTPTPEVYEKYFIEKKIENANVVCYYPPKPGRLAEVLRHIRRTKYLYRTNSQTERVKWEVLRSQSHVLWGIKWATLWFSLLVPSRLLDALLYMSTRQAKPGIMPHDTWLSLAPSFEVEIPLAKWIRNTMPKARKVAFLHSWDNITSKGSLIEQFDTVVVWGKVMAQEVQETHNYKSKDVITIGMPQYDGWQTGLSTEVSALGRPYLLYATGHPGTVPEEPEIVSKIAKQLAEGEGWLLVVRLHPNDCAERYSHLLLEYPCIKVEEPGKRTTRNVDKWEPQESDMMHYRSLLAGAVAVINVASTVTLDAARVGTPVICIAFDGTGIKESISVKRFYRYSHYKKIVDTGCLLVSDTIDDFAALLKKVVAGREDIVRRQYTFLQLHDEYMDGKAGKRLGSIL